MLRRFYVVSGFVFLVCGVANAASAGDLLPWDQAPTHIAECSRTFVIEIGPRLEDTANSGTSVETANKILGISYDQVKEVTDAQVGDPVIQCLMALPQDCPPGDDRGKFYTTTDLRTLESWTLPDSEHSCGGA
jgi:hypothetical protein